ncbi:MAG: IMP dehydrogenase [Spirochaetes bacterium]|nr:IMP dehydrogenase [Spirochaetota bacterium]
MALYYDETSYTFNEFLLVPNLTKKSNTPDNVSLITSLVRYKKNEGTPLKLNIPIVSSVMQSVSNDTLGISLARNGGLSFIFHSQMIEKQVQMIRNVKSYKAGFVKSDSNLKPDNTLKDILALIDKTGHSTIPVTEDGTPIGKLLGLVTSRDFRITKDPLDKKVKDIMTPYSKLVYGRKGISLKDSNNIIWTQKLNCLPIIDEKDFLDSLVFRKDIIEHDNYPNELLDSHKRLMVGAGINTRDYKERIPELIKAGADILCIDSSDGFSEWQKDTIEYVKKNYKNMYIGAGNIVEEEGFNYLADAGADFIKIGIGPASICTTREQKGIGMGQATAVMKVNEARNKYFKNTGIYMPLCADGGIVQDYHITLALAMGADFVMMGRYFARFDESPTNKIKIGNNYVKEYWAEGSNRARNWQRYDLGGSEGLHFEEGIDSYVPYAGSLKSNVDVTISKIKATFANCGANDIKELQEKARIIRVSAASIVESKPHDIIPKNYNEIAEY